MKIYIDDKIIKTENENANDENSQSLYISQTKTKAQTLKDLNFNDVSKIENENTCFESHKGFGYFFFLLPSYDLTENESERVEIYLASKTMLLFYDEPSPIVERWLEIFLATDEKINSVKKAFFNFLSLLTTRYTISLDAIEDKISDLEDSVANEETEDYVSEIRILRKQLLSLRRYYESMLALMEDLEENRDELFSYDELRQLHFHTQKIERLHRNTLNLRDYLTQVREAYQALLDIEANKVMKLFTVITSIFLPLSLLVGWYGMNLTMPETAFPHTYAIVITASIVIVTGLIIYFKRNKWF